MKKSVEPLCVPVVLFSLGWCFTAAPRRLRLTQILSHSPQVEFCGYRLVCMLYVRSRNDQTLGPLLTLAAYLIPPNPKYTSEFRCMVSITAQAITPFNPDLIDPNNPPRFSPCGCIPPFTHADNASSLDALIEALGNLDSLFGAVGDAYTQSFNWGRYERFSEADEGDVPTPPSTLGPLRPL